VSLGPSFGDTNAGKKRRRNEDAFVCEPPLFAVADGMGGAQAGEIASSLAAAALEGVLTEESTDGEQLVVDLIQEANRRVHQRATNDASASGMGTTMTVAFAGPDDLVAIGHVGDSRAYLLRDSSLEQLTDDHSLVAELVRRGELSPEEAEVHPQRSVITRALGTDPDVDVDVFSVAAQPGDVFILCSDGLSTMVDPEAIAEIVGGSRGDLQAAARGLIRAANDAGGEDNITAVMFEIVGGSGVETVERPADDAPAPAPSPDEEDTLHPEDGVVLPPEAYDVPGDERRDGDTVIVSAAEMQAAHAAEQAEPKAPFPIFRAIVSTLVIILLAALVVVLAVWGLAR
jgi:serine/threonine protein phosphatase PrpC